MFDDSERQQQIKQQMYRQHLDQMHRQYQLDQMRFAGQDYK